MAYIRLINEDEATGQRAQDYDYLSKSYSKLLGTGFPTPQVYRTASPSEHYFHYGALINRVLTHDGEHPPSDSPIPNILINFAVARYSSCYY